MCRRRNQTSCYSTSAYQNQNQNQYQYQRGGCCGKRTRRQARRELQVQALAAQLASTRLNTPASTNPPHDSVIQSNLPATQSQQQQQQQIIYVPVPTHSRPQPRGPISGMAALLITGISLGAQKIQERRDKKREAKRALLQDEEQARKEGNVVVIDERVQPRSSLRGAENENEGERGVGGSIEGARVDGRRRKSEEAREERGGRSSSRGSSVHRERESESESGEGAVHGEAPPSYEMAVGQTPTRARN
ncbi:hypothetical protein K491DRAFT_678722 [Lophiostoma macrostomum CBS 122681]|uniref:Uncharacterized protein n=1 Tax=Lophiostoma macrostomum CBS 122681 TaxID=1314788 RepID=A0A6A6T7C4_9PLEO|nr:hypothetical protein K491DRAFT_678722 [Lophiostoma macrostomum CBS 122681]